MIVETDTEALAETGDDHVVTKGVAHIVQRGRRADDLWWIVQVDRWRIKVGMIVHLKPVIYRVFIRNLTAYFE